MVAMIIIITTTIIIIITNTVNSKYLENGGRCG